MTFEEYKIKEVELQKEFDLKRVMLMRSFVDANNPYKIGDRITDHIGTIEIERMGYSWGSFGNPSCATYEGIEINKDGSYNKKGKKRGVYRGNIKKTL